MGVGESLSEVFGCLDGFFMGGGFGEGVEVGKKIDGVGVALPTGVLDVDRVAAVVFKRGAHIPTWDAVVVKGGTVVGSNERNCFSSKGTSGVASKSKAPSNAWWAERCGCRLEGRKRLRVRLI